ncbi:glycoside hydrolase family 3 N-terminal domain-containing protein, partial [Enterobacter hormaechei]|uniref:glycoside hydrolase family 3 N-terminal domain-containing protein n=1 Tax=Enterobacter hormaechei TaxID=158836 RepID=UPI001F0B1EF2
LCRRGGYRPDACQHEIQTQILRNELGYAGVTISDALDMGAIAEHFTQQGAAENVLCRRGGYRPDACQHEIQTQILRNELGYAGVTIS